MANMLKRDMSEKNMNCNVYSGSKKSNINGYVVSYIYISNILPCHTPEQRKVPNCTTDCLPGKLKLNHNNHIVKHFLLVVTDDMIS